MNHCLISVCTWSMVVFAAVLGDEANGAVPNTPAKTSLAWTAEEAARQLTLNPDDAYLQYVALQLARNEGKTKQVAGTIRGFDRRRRRGPERSADLFALFNGALAVQESLQLDTMLADTRAGDERIADKSRQTIKIADLAGPTVKSHPWGKMLAAQSVARRTLEVSKLAKCVPEDQYFVRFGSVNKLLEAVEGGDLWGAHLFSQATRSARTHRTTARLKTQLAVQTDPLTRPFYDMVVDEMAVTGSDLYFRIGSDVTLLFRIKQPEVFRMRMDGFLTAAEESRSDATRTTGKVLDVEYVHVGTPDRELSVFSAYPRPDLHVRSNSRAALERVLETIAGRAQNGPKNTPPLGESTEFKYIRTLMPLGAEEEHGFIYLSDPFIRRVVGPELKLTNARRLLCYNHLRMIGHAAMLYRTQVGRPAASLDELAQRNCAPGLFGEGNLQCPCGGEYQLSDDGTTGVCSHHGHARYLVPCREIPLTRVTKEEAARYKQFLDRYNSYWRTFFDPIAIRVQLTPKQYRAETIILPLIDNSIYSSMAMALGGEPEPLDDLPVPDRNIFSMAFKLDKPRLLAASGLKPPEPEIKRKNGPEENLRLSTVNLKMIALAMHNYHDTRKSFPAVANFGRSNRALLSWRVHLLPFLEQGPLYQEFHLDEPWNSPHNKKLIGRMPDIYKSPGLEAAEAGKTTYVVPVGAGTVFNGTKKGTSFAEIRDGTSNTILAFDAAEKHAVVWTKPDDVAYDTTKTPAELLRRFGDSGLVAYCDGSVFRIPNGFSDTTGKALFTLNGGETVTERGRVAPASRSRRRGPFGINRLLGDKLDERQLYQFLTEGVGDQVGMHVYDAKPMFDFNLTGFLGDGIRRLGGGRFPINDEILYISFLVASLNAPVYISVPVEDPRIVDRFLDHLDELLAELATRPQGNGWFDVDFDFYRVPLGDDDHRSRCYSVQFGPVKWRLFFARIGEGLYVASKRFILEDLSVAEKHSVEGQQIDPGPSAHAMVRVRPEHWKEVAPAFQLGWAEQSRQACLKNLGPLSSVARAATASNESGVSAARIRDQADLLHGVHFFCPDRGRYELRTDGPEIVCSVHGSVMSGRQMPAPAAGSPAGRLMDDFGGITTALTFLEDGLHAVMTIQRK